MISEGTRVWNEAQQHSKRLGKNRIKRTDGNTLRE